MFSKKNIAYVVALLAMGTMVNAAQAADLTISNQTQHDSTCVINDGACSTILGESGVTHPHQTNVISSNKIKFACLLNRSNCKADVYMTANCTGPKIATVIFDTNSGIKTTTMYDNSYAINHEAFTITLSGGPQVTVK